MELLNEIEGALITALEPKRNKQGARWEDVDEYFQFIDDEKRDLTLADILDGHQKIEKSIASLSKRLIKNR